MKWREWQDRNLTRQFEAHQSSITDQQRAEARRKFEAKYPITHANSPAAYGMKGIVAYRVHPRLMAERPTRMADNAPD